MSNWKEVCALKDIPMLGSRRVERARGPQVALFRTAGDEVYALLDRCPHKAGPLSQGLVFGREVSCPLHAWVIGLETGCARLPDEGQTPKFSVRIESGMVLLDQLELDTVAIDLAPVKAGPCAHDC